MIFKANKFDKTCNVYTMDVMSKAIKWDLKKSAWLKASSERGGVGFEECVVLIEAGQILDSIDNPSSTTTQIKRLSCWKLAVMRT